MAQHPANTESTPSVAGLPENLAQVLELLSSARKATSWYQEDHPAAVHARESACRVLNGILRHQPRLLITVIEEGLVIDREHFRQNRDMRALSSRLRERGIRTVTFRGGVDPTELLAFIALTNIDPLRLRAKGGAEKFLHDSGVTGIEVAEIVYDTSPLEGATPPPELLSTTPRGDDLIAQFTEFLIHGDAPLTEEQFEQLLNLLADPALILRLITECVARGERPDDASPASDNELVVRPPRQAISAEVVRRLEQLVVGRSPKAWEGVKDSVRRAVAKLPPAIRPRIFALTQTTEAAETEARQVREPETPARAAARREGVRTILHQLSRALQDAVRAPVPEPGRLGDGRSKEQRDRLGSVLASLAKICIDPTPITEEMEDLLEQAGPAAAEAARVVVALLQVEETAEGYSHLATVLERKTKSLLAKGQRGVVLDIFATFAAQAGPGQAAWQRSRARAALEAIGFDGILSFLATVLLTADQAEADVAGAILELLGPPAIPRAVSLLAESLPRPSEEAVTRALIRIGNLAVPNLEQTLGGGYSRATFGAAKILGSIGTAESVQALSRGLKSSDPLLRLFVAQWLGKSGHRDAVDLLLDALHDRDASVRRSAVAALGEMNDDRAFRALVDLAVRGGLAPRALELRLLAIDCVGASAEEAAVEPLGLVLRRRGWWPRPARDQLRVRAVNALGRLGTPAAMKLIRTAATDRRPAVREAGRRFLTADGGT
jgi:HEAT repeat protein